MGACIPGEYKNLDNLNEFKKEIKALECHVRVESTLGFI